MAEIRSEFAKTGWICYSMIIRDPIIGFTLVIYPLLITPWTNRADCDVFRPLQPPAERSYKYFCIWLTTMPVRGFLISVPGATRVLQTCQQQHYGQPHQMTMPSSELPQTATSSDSLQTVTSDKPQTATSTNTLLIATSTDSPSPVAPTDSLPTAISSKSLQRATSDLPQTAVPSNFRVAASHGDWVQAWNKNFFSGLRNFSSPFSFLQSQECLKSMALSCAALYSFMVAIFTRVMQVSVHVQFILRKFRNKAWCILVLPLVIYHWKSHTTECHIPLFVIHHCMSYTTVCHLPLYVIYHSILYNNVGHIPLYVIYHFMSYNTVCHIPLYVIHH